MIARTRRRREAVATTYKLCSLALSYPDDELVAARERIRGAVADLPRGEAAAALERFYAWWAGTDPLEVAQHYVETFDLHKRSGLYLTYYGEGDRRERGMALLRLKRLYRAAGLALDGRELPDHLAVLLEFVAATAGARGEVLLREHRAALELIRAGLRERSSPYADVLDAVCATLGEPSLADRARVAALAASGPPRELVGLEPFAPPEVMPSAEPMR